MTLQLLHSEFLIYAENLIFFFISVGYLARLSWEPGPADMAGYGVIHAQGPLCLRVSRLCNGNRLDERMM
jgi:hypothetical protein